MAKKRTKLLNYFLALFAAFLLIFIPAQFFTPFKFSVIQAASLPMRIVSFPFKEMKKMLFYHRTFTEYLRIKKERDVLKARITGLDEVIRENNRLEILLKFKRSLIYSSIAANVIGRDPSNWSAVMIMDKGEDDGVEVGMSVVNALGVVGKVAEVGKNKSKVILLTDPSFSVAALISRSRETGLVSGTLQGLSRIRYLPADADVQVGDQVITSKLSSSFPEGLIIGEVINVHKSEKSPTMDCIVQPSVSLSQIEEVLVILKQ